MSRLQPISHKHLDLIVYDFDGVMTDNKVLVLENGLEAVRCNRSDGLAVGYIKKLNILQIIISTETNKVVQARAKKLKIKAISGVKNKKEALVNFCRLNGFSLKKVVYIGNDINDLEVMKVVGFPLCPQDAHSSIKKISKVVLKTKGGDGVVREFLDLLT